MKFYIYNKIMTQIANSALEYIVEVKNLTKIFRDFWGRPKARAVDKINLRIRSGQVFGLLGPNGSGKSTTVKLILGLLYPTRGSIRLLGESPTNVAIKRHIGYQPEETYLYPYLTAAETLDFFGSLLGIDPGERRKRSGQLLEMVGLSGAGSRTVGEYSKGMARRLALAQALINDPDLVVLDEPTAGLDPIACREIKDVIRVLAERGKTVLLCSHLLADVEDVCDTVTVLYGGRIWAEGPVEELLKIKDQTRIVAPAMSQEDLTELTHLLAEKTGDGELLIDHPRISLEQFFLDVIKQAQAGTAEISGARAGTGIAEFLDSDQGGKKQKEDSQRALQQLAKQVPEAGPAESGVQGESAGEGEGEDGVVAAAKDKKRILEHLDGDEEQPIKSEAAERKGEGGQVEISGEEKQDNRQEEEEEKKTKSSEKLRDLLDPNR